MVKEKAAEGEAVVGEQLVLAQGDGGAPEGGLVQLELLSPCLPCQQLTPGHMAGAAVAVALLAFAGGRLGRMQFQGFILTVKGRHLYLSSWQKEMGTGHLKLRFSLGLIHAKIHFIVFQMFQKPKNCYFFFFN